MTKRRVKISDETGDVYFVGHDGTRPIGHIEDFLHQHTPLANAVRARWKQYLHQLDQSAARRNSTTGYSVQR
jgi:cyanophycinase-like exopeptidase